MESEHSLAALHELYRRVDEQTSHLSSVHAQRLQCRRGCTMCCVDEITVFEVEAENIRQHNQTLIDTGQPHPPGMCAFLHEGACRIYDQRPYVCRTQGLPLRWLDESQGATVEMRDICPLNESNQPLENLDADACWTIGPPEASLAQIQAARAGGEELRRIPLRDLFR